MGGVPQASQPTAADDVHFGNGTSATNNNCAANGSVCRSIDCTGYTGALTINNSGTALAVGDASGGALTFVSGMGLTVGGTSSTITMASTSNNGGAGWNITTGGKTMPGVTLNGVGGKWVFADNFTSSEQFTVTNGDFDSNNKTVSVRIYASTGAATRSSTWGTSTVSITSTAAANVINLTSTAGLSAASATFVISTTSASNRTIVSGGLTFGTITYTVAGSTGSLIFTGNTVIGTLNFSDVTNARSVTFPNGTTTITTLNVNGTSGKLTTVAATTGGSTTCILTKGGTGYWSGDYLNVTDIKCPLPYVFYAGVNSTGSGNNVNINLIAPIVAPYTAQGAGANANATSVTATLPIQTATAGSLLIVGWNAVATPGAITDPTGFTQAVTVGSVTVSRIYYKIAAGGETGATVSQANSVVVDIFIIEVFGWTGTPTLDVTDSNSSGSTTTLSTTAGTGPTNAVPAFAFVNNGLSSTGTTSVSWSNGYEEEYNAASTRMYIGELPLATAAAQSTTHVWTTSRSANAILAVFKDVAAAGGTTPLRMLTGVGT